MALVGQNFLQPSHINYIFLLRNYFIIHPYQTVPLKTDAIHSSETLEHSSTTQSRNPKKTSNCSTIALKT
jgi:hypothetical protein